MTETTQQRVFISYRRTDCQAQANGLHDGLRNRLADARIFMDIDSIPPGADFEEHIRNEIEQCHVVLVLIGDNWLDPRPGGAVRRLDETNDFVRLEVESALAAQNVRVIPVLVEGAQMPGPEDLPESIRRLARLNAIELGDSRWTSDLERLAEQLRRLGASATVRETGPTVSFDDIDPDAIGYAVALLPSTFKTKDVSEHSAVLATHAEVSGRRNYHTMIGRYLMKHRHRLGLGEPAAPVDDRGSVWSKSLATPSSKPGNWSPPAQFRATVGSSGSASRAAVAPAPLSRWARYRRSRWFMTTLPLVTCGLAAWVPPLWVASKRKSDPSFRRKMYAVSGGIVLVVVAGFALIGSAPEDATGTPTGPLSNVGVTLMLLAMTAGAVVGFVFRDREGDLPGAHEQLAKRELRESYRQLVSRDRSLAASMMVGRPDVRRDYDDGGLLDLNSLSAEALHNYGRLSMDEANRLVELRSQLGRFVDINEVTAYISLSEAAIARLQESSVCV
ncbi:toll/interleukin-1 receptor domain-containing protein [Nocardioides cynanchi]|uniref:toll/interleukin-1 receptor domain-containing protein n=1 Tax=Nocardioides cynanchi TaxID=2558918 RepID=UPI00177F869F|nr:toll/interleukin-1 receptor domain-containing protein [Nocardioides cynanchi]